MSAVQLRDSDRGFEISVDGDRVGYITFDKRGDGGYIQRVFVDPDHRGNGYAKAAVGQLVEQFDGRLTSGPSASQAMERGILRAHGFEFRHGEDRPDGCEADIWVHD